MHHSSRSPEARASRRWAPCAGPAPQPATRRTLPGHAAVSRHVIPPHAGGVTVAAMTAGTAIRASLTIPGHPEQVRAARAFTARRSGTITLAPPSPSCWSASWSPTACCTAIHVCPAGRSPITVTGTPDGARVEVRDAGGASVPFLEGRR